MDNVTHTLFALTLARTPLARAGRGTTAALVLASNAPDIDIVATARGASEYLRWHRGPTHGPLGVIGLGIFVAGLVWIANRLVQPKTDAASSASGPATRPAAAPFHMLLAVSMIGVVCHILMDLPTSYGTRLLSPFDWHWFAVDWLPIVDIYLLFALAAGLLFGQMSAGARHHNAAIVMALMAANYGVRAAAHHEALVKAPRLYGPLLPQPCEPVSTPFDFVDSWPRTRASSPADPTTRCLVEMIAIPTFLSPFKWRIVAHLSNAYELHDVDLLDPRLRRPAERSEVLWRTTRRVPNVWTTTVVSAASTDLARTFLGFSRLPAARSVVDRTGTATVRWSDMRFTGMTVAPTQDDPFSAVVRIAADGRVLEQQLGR
jgi:membrane-bound metal-dependent hydrolase YbcI (DUF457 family)